MYLITDRTQADVDSAIEIINGKVKKKQALSTSDIETLERGTITINTLNRIEEKQAELKVLFDSQGYYTPFIVNKHWTDDDIFGEGDFQRIINNTYLLRNAFYVYMTTPKTVSMNYTYKNMNDLERILFDLNRMMDYVVFNYKQCDTFYCGEA